MTFRVALLFAVLAGTASAQERFALVIGNGKYSGAAALNNPTNDAAAVAAALEKLDFKVTKKTDADLEAIENAVADFSKSLNKKSVALFFYAGHGLQVRGENYLVPLGADVKEEAQVKRKCYPVDELLAELDNSNAALKVVILDSCRDNPLTRSWKRSAESGLASIGRIPHGTIIAFSTAPGETALDGRGQNSPFTKHLVASLDKRPQDGLELIDALRATGQAVSREIGQRPWLNFDTSIDDFYLWRGKPFLGVGFDFDSPNIKVAALTPDGPADKAGMKDGDLVLGFNGDEINTIGMLLTKIKECRPGERVSIHIKRGEQELDLKIAIGNLPE